MSQWVIHRDPRFFDDPEAFRPERWADGLAKRIPRYAYFPFGGGPRICIGNGFAMMEARPPAGDDRPARTGSRLAPDADGRAPADDDPPPRARGEGDRRDKISRPPRI